MKEEVDGIIAKYRCRSDQSSADVLSTLDLSCWQSEFPMILLSLRESIRLSTMAAIFRLNHSSADIPIGDGTEVLPKDAFAVRIKRYSVDLRKPCISYLISPDRILLIGSALRRSPHESRNLQGSRGI